MRLAGSRKLYAGAGFLALLLVLGSVRFLLQGVIAQSGQAPRFEVDPLWPKPLPNHWVLGQTIGVWVDERDHIWIVHRGNDSGNLDNTELAVPTDTKGQQVRECCTSAPPVLEFDVNG